MRSIQSLVRRMLCAAVILVLAATGWTSIAATLPQGFSEQTISGPSGSDWAQAVGMQFEDNGRMYVWERAGRVWIQEPGETRWQLLIDISEEVGAWGDFGLLGFALDPRFRINGRYYLAYVVDRHHLRHFGSPGYQPAANEYSDATIARITRYTAQSGDGFATTDPGSRKILVGESATNGIPILYRSHGVGSLVFGTDGTLLASTGDGSSFVSTDVGNASETYFARALSEGIIGPKENVGSFRSHLVDSLNGKILRIDPETGDGIPSNPYYDSGSPRAARSRVWALGFRNPCRFTLRPGTGSHVRSDANPGVLLLGDVGWFRWEEFNVCSAPGQNFGWPLFEGMDPMPSYSVPAVLNLDAPNPLFPQSGCRPHFTLGNLLRQNSSSAGAHPPFENPCNPASTIPATTPQFLHTPPVLDWMHGTNLVRSWIHGTGGVLTPVRIGGSASPVSGGSFPGNCSIGGVWYGGTDFPTQYRDSYFHADYGANWIRQFKLDASNRISSVTDFLGDGGGIVCVATHPVTGGLYYLSMPSQLRRVSFSVDGNLPPIARVRADRTYGPGPLTVRFAGDASTDPEGLALTHDWDFGDGTAHSSEANPTHTFEAPVGTARRFEVTLRVTDTMAQTSSASRIISVNNTAPSVRILSPLNGGRYPMSGDTVYPLLAEVADAESANDQLRFEWRTFLHHNNHEHEELVDTNQASTWILAPVGCDGVNLYYYRVQLTVTDPAGLSTTVGTSVFPDCRAPDLPPTISTIPDQVVQRNQTAGPLTFLVTDAEIASPYLELNATSSNPILIPDENIAFGTRGLHRTVTLKPVAGRSGTSTITIAVNDGPNTSRSTFQVEVTEVDYVPLRTEWQIGIANDPAVNPYRPTAEFSPQNNLNDPMPGKVTRRVGDPEFLAATNPSADDDFYFAGRYPAGFNALPSLLNVPNDEPAIAWERAHSVGDRTNRVHFVVDPAQVTAASAFQLSFELVSGGSTIGGIPQPGFSDHDMVVRFRNAAGIATELFSRRISQTTHVVIPFAASAVQATPGANTIEIVRTGPAASGVSYFIQYDYLRLESQPVGNLAPDIARPSDRIIHRFNPLTLSLSAVDADIPAQNLRFSLVRGPSGMTVSPAGLLLWTPNGTHAAGPYDVTIRVTDDGIPALKADAQFTVTVTGGNSAPVLLPVGLTTVDGLVPLQLTLAATDADVPPQNLTFSLVNGPSGLVVSPAGVVTWTPAPNQEPRTYDVEVEVSDDGTPSLANRRTFTIRVNAAPGAIPLRTQWLIGVNDDPTVSPYRPTAEFSPQNNLNDRPPGKVTRLPLDPEHVATSNPAADDDHYFAGTYPAGFNGLTTPLNVPNDEPAIAWERAHTVGDRTNRVHFVVDPAQVAAMSTFQLSFELVSGGATIGGILQPGFADHDMVVRFRNAAGIATDLFSRRISQTSHIVIPFAASTVQATPGANTIEIVRTGPAVPGVSYFVQYDYLLLESRPVGNTPPTLTTPPNPSVDPFIPLSLSLIATDQDVPAQAVTFSLVIGPSGLAVSPAGLVTWTPSAVHAAGTHPVTVRATDNGFPVMMDQKTFTLSVNESPAPISARSIWQIGTDDDPADLPYRPNAEFGSENGKNDLRPGKVTRQPGDPEYVAESNPTADDDFYFSGYYPAGFNGLSAPLNVPVDEPPIAWERAHTSGDRTNRIHFPLDPTQVTSTSAFRLTLEWVKGGSKIGTILFPGFADHAWSSVSEIRRVSPLNCSPSGYPGTQPT